MKIALMILLLLPVYGFSEDLKIHYAYPTEQAIHEVFITVLEDKILLDKKSNFFDKHKNIGVGEFSLKRSSVDGELKDILKVKKNMDNISAHLAQFDKEIQEMLPNREGRQSFIKINEHFVSEQSSYYKLLRKRVGMIINHHLLRPVNTSRIDISRSQSIKINKGKEVKEFIRVADKCKRLNNEYLCETEHGLYYHRL